MAHGARSSLLIFSAALLMAVVGCAHVPPITAETLGASECLPAGLGSADALAGLRALRDDEPMPAALREKLLGIVACMGHEALDEALREPSND